MALEAAATLALTGLALRIVDFRRWQGLLARTAPNPPRLGDVSESLLDRCRRIARIQRSVAGRLPFQTNCLEQASVLWWLLRRRGIAAEMRIGARKEAARFEAHAWVEVGGVRFSEAGEGHPRFIPFDRPIGSAEIQPR